MRRDAFDDVKEAVMAARVAAVEWGTVRGEKGASKGMVLRGRKGDEQGREGRKGQSESRRYE